MRLRLWHFQRMRTGVLREKAASTYNRRCILGDNDRVRQTNKQTRFEDVAARIEGEEISF